MYIFAEAMYGKYIPATIIHGSLSVVLGVEPILVVEQTPNGPILIEVIICHDEYLNPTDYHKVQGKYWANNFLVTDTLKV